MPPRSGGEPAGRAYPCLPQSCRRHDKKPAKAGRERVQGGALPHSPCLQGVVCYTTTPRRDKTGVLSRAFVDVGAAESGGLNPQTKRGVVVYPAVGRKAKRLSNLAVEQVALRLLSFHVRWWVLKALPYRNQKCDVLLY